MFDVVTLGSATADIFLSSTDLSENRRFLSVKKSSKNEISRSLISSGGGATNSAVTFSRLGFKSAVVAQMGTDPLSAYVIADLKKEKVSTSLIKSTPKHPTDFSIILVGQDGSRSILTQRGSIRLESRDIPWSKIKKCRWLYLTSLEGNLSLLEQLIGFAKENNISISFNPGNRELSQRRQLLPLLKHLDFLLLNRYEAEILSDRSHKEATFYPTLQQCAPLVAVTNGRHGAKILTPDNSYFMSIINHHPLDETGAGDAFGSAFVAALLSDQSITQALNWASQNSASVVGHFGAKEGILTLKEMKHASKT